MTPGGRLSKDAKRKREVRHVPSSSAALGSFLFFFRPKAPRTFRALRATPRRTPRVFVSLSCPPLPGPPLTLDSSRARDSGTRGLLYVKSTVSPVFDLRLQWIRGSSSTAWRVPGFERSLSVLRGLHASRYRGPII